MNDPSTPSSEVSAKRADGIIDGAPQPESRMQEKPIANEQRVTTVMEDPGPVPTAADPPGKGKSAKTANARSSGAATKSGGAFSVREEDWKEGIPEPGHYDAIISFASINPKSDITYLHLHYSIVDTAGRPFVVTEMTVLDARATNPRYTESAQGRGRVKAIMEVNRKSPSEDFMRDCRAF